MTALDSNGPDSQVLAWHADDGNGLPYIELDGSEDWMLLSNFADDPSSMTIFVVAAGGSGPIFDKTASDDLSTPGWSAQLQVFFPVNVEAQLQISDGTNTQVAENGSGRSIHVYTFQMVDRTTSDVFIDGSDSGADFSGSAITSFSNGEPVRIGASGAFGQFCGMSLYRLIVYIPALSPTDRAAKEAALKTEYGTP
jgi:hypothetical protein